MILRAFKDKFIRLAREEDGVALVVTLAVFFFIYLICMGVYAVGTNVRERIHLQNACDAAAYSAAVVQADTLSRIATINRAMSWTYVQMTRRQMDYIVYKWLDATVKHYEDDLETSFKSGSPGKHVHKFWDIDANELSKVDPYLARYLEEREVAEPKKDKVKFHHSYDVEVAGPDGIKEHLKIFRGTNLGGGSFDAENLSVSGVSRLRVQIRSDKEAIADMNNMEENLIDDLHKRMDAVAKEILKANLCYEKDFDDEIGSCTYYHLEATETPIDTYMTYLGSIGEGRFLKWWKGTNADVDAKDVFEKGIDDWFVLSEGKGFLRKYYQSEALRSSWHWVSWTWECEYSLGSWTCKWNPIPVSGDPEIKAVDLKVGQENNPDDEAYYFVGERAKPMILTKKYFGEEGTVSVRVARKNVNPFVRILRGFVEADGIFAAFNPFVEWTFAVASAKAGYRRWNWDANQPVEEDGEREYRIDWREDQTIWNLRTSDWDAVLIPVRMAKSDAKNEEWTLGKTGFLSDWMTGEWEPLGDGGDTVNVRLQAGGKRSQEGDWDVLRNESAPDQQWWNWKTPLVYQTNEGAGNRVDVEWQVENSGWPIDWGRLTERIFH